MDVMARYIDADVCLNAMLSEMVGTGYQSRAMDVIKFSHTADVAEVKCGYWEDLRKGKYDNPLYTCSICYCKALYEPDTDELGKIVFKQELSKVCPNCGAKMDGGNTDGD